MINRTSVSDVQERVKGMMSEKRYKHTLGVMEMAERIGYFCLSDKIDELLAAALLHDVAKEFPDTELCEIIKGNYDNSEEIIGYGREIWHSYAAPYVVKRDFPIFATENILSAVQKHTLGAPDMSVFDEVIFISDYVEAGRTYPSCAVVRDYLYQAFESDKQDENIDVLHKACIMSIEYTEENLKSRGKGVCPVSLLAKNALKSKIKY